MSELPQDDDPDPHPSPRHEYPVNWHTGLAYDDYESAKYYAEQQRISLERAAVVRLSNRAARVIEQYDAGDKTKGQTKRIAAIDRAALSLVIGDGLWAYGLTETLEDGVHRRYVWKLGGDAVSCCEDEDYHYKPAEEVLSRLEALFPVEEEYVQSEEPSRLRRILAILALR